MCVWCVWGGCVCVYVSLCVCARVYVCLCVLPGTIDLCLCVCALRLCLCVCVCGVSVTQCARKSCQRPYIFNIVDDFWLKSLHKLCFFRFLWRLINEQAYKRLCFFSFLTSFGVKKLINTVLFQLFVVSWNYGDWLGPSQARASHHRSQNQSKAEKAQFLQAFSLKKLEKSWKSLVLPSFFKQESSKRLKKHSFLIIFYSFVRGASERLRKFPCLPPQKKKEFANNKSAGMWFKNCSSRFVIVAS